MRRSGNQMLWGFVAVAISVISFAVVWGVVLPKYKTEKQTMAQLDAEVSAARDKLESLKKAKTSIEGMGDVFNQLLIAVPADKDTSNTLTELEAVGSKYGIYIPSIQIEDSSTNSSIPTDKVNIALSISGSFENLQGFINSLENNLKFFNIRSMTLSSTYGDKISLSMQISAYKSSSSQTSGTVLSTPDDLIKETR